MKSVFRTVRFAALCLIAGVGEWKMALGADALPSSAPGNEPVLKVSAFWSATGAKPGGEIALAVVLEIRKPFHVNPNRTKGELVPTTVKVVDAPDWVRKSTPIFPSALRESDEIHGCAGGSPKTCSTVGEAHETGSPG
jgi:hypothetical protein